MQRSNIGMSADDPRVVLGRAELEAMRTTPKTSGGEARGEAAGMDGSGARVTSG